MTESVEGTILTKNIIQLLGPGATSFTDTTGGVWTYSTANNGEMLRNGVQVGGNSSVQIGVYVNNTVSVLNKSNAHWYTWNGSAWVDVVFADPRNAVSITDSSGNLWNMVDCAAGGPGNTVYMNNAPLSLGVSTGVVKLVYHNHKVYEEGGGNWWYWDGTTPWVATTDPTVASLANFWGVQTHVTWNWSLAACYQKPNWSTLISKLQDLGIKVIRNDIDQYSTDVLLDFINNYATPAGIQVIPTLLGDYTSGETASYNMGVTLGNTVATALTGKVPFFEVGNETDSDCILSGHLGTANTDYNNAYYLNSRGFVRGMIAGIKQVDTTTPIIIGGIVETHTAFLEMLWNGTQPNGSTSPNTVRWDVTASHFYINNNTSIDNPENFNGVNLLQKLTQFGKPIHINEYGANFSEYSGETAVATALTGSNSMGCWYAKRATYNITYCSMYQLMDAAAQGTSSTDDEMNFGLVGNNGTTNKGRYATVKTFIAGHQS